MRASAMEGGYGVRILQYRYVLRMETAGEQCAGMSPRWGCCYTPGGKRAVRPVMRNSPATRTCRIFRTGAFRRGRNCPTCRKKRRGRAALAREELPPLDFVLITHDHYDHLEAATIRHFARQATVPRFIVPLGLGVRLQGWGIPADKITELGWAESTTAGALILTAVPAGAFG